MNINLNIIQNMNINLNIDQINCHRNDQKISNFIKFTNIKDKHRFFISKKGKVSNFIFQISIV